MYLFIRNEKKAKNFGEFKGLASEHLMRPLAFKGNPGTHVSCLHVDPSVRFGERLCVSPEKVC